METRKKVTVKGKTYSVKHHRSRREADAYAKKLRQRGKTVQIFKDVPSGYVSFTRKKKKRRS